MTEGGLREAVRPRWLLVSLLIAVSAWWLGGLLPFSAEADPAAARLALGVTALTTSCWLTSAMPLAAASLLPLVLLPVLGVRSAGAVSQGYSHPVLWLFGGGFVLAQAIEKWGLHRRLSLWVLQLVGPHPRRLVLGFLFTSTVLSFFINNTSTALMLLPIGWALVQRACADADMDPKAARSFATAIMLAIAYGASFGGIATPIGTAPNALFFANYQRIADAPPVSFLHWVLAFAPFSLLLAFFTSFVLTRGAIRVPKERLPHADALDEEVRSLGKMSKAERRVGLLFLVAVLLWATRADVRLGDSFTIPGWAGWLLPDLPESFIADGTVSIGIAVLAFLVPAGTSDGRRIMDWPTARKIPFEILFLLGGGIALADSFEPTGLSLSIGNLLAPMVGQVHPMVLLLVLVSAIVLLSEVGSNTAIAALFLPLLVAASKQAELDPRILMLPATVAASCGFMLPIATPPNALVFATGHVTFRQMAKAGFWVDLIAVVLLVLVLWFWAMPLLGVDPMAAGPR